MTDTETFVAPWPGVLVEMKDFIDLWFLVGSGQRRAARLRIYIFEAARLPGESATPCARVQGGRLAHSVPDRAEGHSEPAPGSKSSTGDNHVPIGQHRRILEQVGLGVRAHGHRRAGARCGEREDSGDAIRPTATRYAPIARRSSAGSMRSCARTSFASGDRRHETFLLHYIEIVADSQGAAELTQFPHEFSPGSRVGGSRNCWAVRWARHVSVDQFLGLDREFTAAELAETDPFEEK
jgi:hypothetical protein